ncbi:hypothetical protein NMG60_11002910, partial [Bertholletia excelsa]
HDHSLIFNEMPTNNMNCYACEQPISGPLYDCKRCLFFLHKSCAELPRELTHPYHPEHALILRPNPPTNYACCRCDVCSEICTRFIYHCSTCKFDVDINCALVVHNVQQRVQQACHQHELTPLHKPALFFCDACGTEHKGPSYLCTTCGFWANEQCVSLPTTIKLRDNHHPHPLILTYSIPYEYYRYIPRCNICHVSIYRRHWTYGCHECQYWVHVYCATPEIQDCKANIKVSDNEFHPISLPMPDESVDLVTQFIKDITLEGTYRGELDIINNSHQHPLIFFDNQVEDEQCHGCQQTISVPFYYCAQCNFSLHQWCAELPKELWHPIHPEHPLLLITERPLDDVFYACAFCSLHTDGYVFGCTKCKFYLDIKCTSLPRIIKHEAHKHPLALRKTYSKCNACRSHRGFGYECDTCKYNLDVGCVLLPRTIKHRYDEHPFVLIYGVSSLDQVDDEYYCEICEGKVDSDYWFYHCHECNQSLHMGCIRPTWWHFDRGHLKVAEHSHYLKFGCRLPDNSPCSICGKHEEDSLSLIWECLVCRFWTHRFWSIW